MENGKHLRFLLLMAFQVPLFWWTVVIWCIFLLVNVYLKCLTTLGQICCTMFLNYASLVWCGNIYRECSPKIPFTISHLSMYDRLSWDLVMTNERMGVQSWGLPDIYLNRYSYRINISNDTWKTNQEIHWYANERSYWDDAKIIRAHSLQLSCLILYIVLQISGLKMHFILINWNYSMWQMSN